MKTKFYSLPPLHTIKCTVEEIVKIDRVMDQSENYEFTSVKLYLHSGEVYKAVITKKVSSIQEYQIFKLKPATEAMFDIMMDDAMDFFEN